MRYAIFSDIHGNRQAWEAVLRDMEALQAQVLVCLGDVVGYGPCPQEVLAGIRSRTDNLVIGNHDAAAAGLMDASVFNPSARQAIEWTRDKLDAESLEFLAGLPLAIEAGDLLFVHAEVADPGRFGYIDDVGTAHENFLAGTHRVTFVGHTHYPALFQLAADGVVTQLPDRDCVLDAEQRFIVNVGSVGEPRSLDDIRARYVIYDSDTGKLYHRRISFDPEAYRADLQGSGVETMPWFLTVVDQRRASSEQADRGMVAAAGSSMGPGGPARQLVLPAGSAGTSSSAERPVPEPTPQERRRIPRASLVLFSLLLLAVAAFCVAAFRELRRNGGEEVATVDPGTPVARPSAVSPGEPARGEQVDPSAEGGSESPPVEAGGLPSESPASESEPAIAVVPEPGGAPDLPPTDPAPGVDPGTDPGPEPDPGPPPMPVVVPIPPEPENLANLPPLAEGLVFYAPFDEVGSDLTAQDQSSGGRHLDISGARPGEMGQIGFACRLEPGGGGLTSEAKALPELTALTISLWIRRPKPAPDLEPELVPASEAMPAEAAAPEPPVNLVSMPEFFELRLENNQVVADLDRMGEVGRLDLPRDWKWHHVMVVNGGGNTSIHLDHIAHAEFVETLGPVPPGDRAVRIGAAESDLLIDEVAIWSRSFTPAERQLVYRRGRLGEAILTPPKVIAYWSFDEEAGGLFQDATGPHVLGAYKTWKPVQGIAPDPVPLTRKPNSLAAQVFKVAERPENAGAFQMRSDGAFTFEGWVKLGVGSSGTIGGTTGGATEDGVTGWRLAVRRGEGINGFLAFLYENGVEKVQALASDLPLYNGLPHHFAAVWNPLDTPAAGKVILYLDNEEVASTSLPLGSLGPPSDEPFRIEVERSPVVLDELRFTSAALEPSGFLTGGGSSTLSDDPAVNPDSIPEGETLLQRRDREAKERRAKRDEAIEERRREDEEKRNRRKLGIERNNLD